MGISVIYDQIRTNWMKILCLLDLKILRNQCLISGLNKQVQPMTYELHSQIMNWTHRNKTWDSVPQNLGLLFMSQVMTRELSPRVVEWTGELNSQFTSTVHESWTQSMSNGLDTWMGSGSFKVTLIFTDLVWVLTLLHTGTMPPKETWKKGDTSKKAWA